MRNKSQLAGLVERYTLGKDAAKDTANNAEALDDKIKDLIIRNGNAEGKITTFWCKMTTQQRYRFTSRLREVSPWFKHFENDWGTDWVLSRAVNLHVTKSKRSLKQKWKLNKGLKKEKELVDTGASGK